MRYVIIKIIVQMHVHKLNHIAQSINQSASYLTWLYTEQTVIFQVTCQGHSALIGFWLEL